jgi:hypothetical protein
MNSHADIDQIKHELEVLRARYALYERWGKILRNFLKVWLLILFFLMVMAAVRIFQSDPVYGIFFVGMMLIIVGCCWLINRIWPLKPRFWVDLASPLTTRFSMYPSFNVHSRNGFRSDAEIIEQQIATREKRLSELGAAK